jgi:protease III
MIVEDSPYNMAGKVIVKRNVNMITLPRIKGMWLLWMIAQVMAFFVSSVNAKGLSYQMLPDTISKSERDQRQYQAIKLANQMTVLLVSDPEAVKSLGALGLPAGSLQDPINQQGLAHYTEHMVLMGSTHFPEPDGFSEFLSKHAGKYNASTAAYRTAFYFEIENSALSEALDRLSDAIAFPLLDAHYADKERNAVNAEMTLARSRDGFRISQVDSETINQNHPSAKFFGGNLETLSNKPDSLLHDALVTFYQRYYSANLMVGVIYGQLSLTELADMAVASFGRITNHHASVEPINEPAITANETGKLIRLEPAQPKRLLYLQFPIENNLDQFAKKSDEYISYLISHRSQGTLADTLQKQGLIDSITSFTHPNRYGNSGLFTIAIDLTEQGLVKKDEVVSAVFNYIRLLQQQGIKSEYYDEIKRVLALDFKYQNVSRDMSYVEWLVDQMLTYPLNHILNADYIANQFDKKAIQDRLSQLVPDNARIWVITPNQHYDKEAYFIQAPYQISDFTSQQKQHWQHDDSWQFHLPVTNPFIADDFSLLDPSQISSDIPPFNPQGNIIQFASRYFANEPKAGIVLSLRQNHILEEAKDKVNAHLLNYLAGRAMAQLSFQAGVAGINLNSGLNDGLTLSAVGFSQHLPDMLIAMFKIYQTLTITDEDVVLAKSWYLQQLSSADNVNSYSLAIQPLQALNQIPYSERATRRQYLSAITADDILQYRNHLLNHAVPYLLSIGNISKKTLADLYTSVKPQGEQHYTFTPIKPIQITKQRQAQLEQQAASTDNALAMIYLSRENDEMISKANSTLLAKIIAPWFYQQLRSEEQLGYAVFNFSVNIGQSYGLAFLIQSNQYDPSYLYQRYTTFYPTALARLKALNETEFEQYKQGLISELQQPPQTLDEEMERYLVDFMKSTFSFDSRQKLIKQLKRVTPTQLIQFYQDTVLDKDGLVLASSIIGKDKDGHETQSLADFMHYANASSLQQALLTDEK